MKLNRNILLLSVTLTATSMASAQETSGTGTKDNRVTLTGSVQSDMLVPQGKQEDGSNEDFRTNTYVDFNLQSHYVDAGARYEYLEHPLPGFENDFKGNGVPYFYVKGNFKNVELTGGTFYEQFGSGFILRSYEERSLGIDNSILGGRIVVTPLKGVRLKALGGVHRRYWKWNWGRPIFGTDLTLSLDQRFHKLQRTATYLTLGASWVNKRESDDGSVYRDATHRLRLPENVNSWDARVNLEKGGFNVLAEYAQKTQDPSFDNGYIYRKGYTTMLSTSYSKKGMSILLQAKRTDNMSSRSKRGMTGTSSFIDHMPPFAYEHTYTLAALYPYATQLALGEWAYQGQFAYTFRKHTAFGGRYGTLVQVNFSHIHSLDKNYRDIDGTPANGPMKGSDGYGSAFWKWGGQTYYQDLNVQIDKRVSRDFHLHLMYMNQFYNKSVIEGEGGMIHSNIYVAEGKYKLAPKTTLRGELQYLTTSSDDHDWAFALLELSLVPHWMFTVSDEYNVGRTEKHYWNLLATYNIGSHRIQAGYVRTRAGYNCSGGVCRYVPSYQGFTVSYNYNF